MPRVYRAMLKDGEHPAVGNSAHELGVRVPNDISPDADGIVSPGTGGMSVAPEWRELPSFRVPRRLQDKKLGATGKDSLHCWRLGEGPFAECPIAHGLHLRPDSDKHGLIEPATSTGLQEYREALAATQDQWVIDEE